MLVWVPGGGKRIHKTKTRQEGAGMGTTPLRRKKGPYGISTILCASGSNKGRTLRHPGHKSKIFAPSDKILARIAGYNPKGGLAHTGRSCHQEWMNALSARHQNLGTKQLWAAANASTNGEGHWSCWMTH